MFIRGNSPSVAELIKQHDCGWRTCCDPKVLNVLPLEHRHDQYRVEYANMASSEVGTVLSLKVFECQFTLQGG